ncbi:MULTISPECIES: tetratricopeptide repeat protein [unclassified Polaribacter]|uniref:tetratricopeptide repeat protein n=1 Tax=unclassified Polaribacter TaxID=196858 RepID=UPI0011BE0DCA|nr:MULTISPECIES: tetratricopeptide repeat protein [unclassified Polaribacter]TXD53606.1 tetratricopeptide repeat protein [Polaribacter sp. IC063]TXD62153.1 tetratricopeptide repeat protein [Polaribacter sp. IC066]
MKNKIVALSLGLMSIATFAQKNELKTAEKAIKKGLFKEAQAAILPLESMEANMDSKYEAKYYFVKGAAYGKMDPKKAAEAYNKLFQVEKESGKSRYTDDATPQLNDLIQFVSEKAVKAYNTDKDYEVAAKNFYLTYKLSPTDTSFLYNAAVSASLAKKFDQSLNYYKELQNIGYTGVKTEFFAISADTDEKENLGSKENRDTMVKFGKYNNPTQENSESKEADIVKNISYILIAQGKTDEAIVAIKKARESDPKDLNLLLNEAQLYIKLGQMDKFGALMQEAIELDPNNPTLLFNLGVVNQNEKKTEEAIGYYKKAIELDPEYGDAYMNLSVAILSGEKEIVDEMNKNLSNFKKYDELAVVQKALYKRALPYLEKADSIKRTEETVKSLLNIYDLTGNTSKAEVLRPIYKKLRGM